MSKFSGGSSPGPGPGGASAVKVSVSRIVAAVNVFPLIGWLLWVRELPGTMNAGGGEPPPTKVFTVCGGTGLVIVSELRSTIAAAPQVNWVFGNTVVTSPVPVNVAVVKTAVF